MCDLTFSTLLRACAAGALATCASVQALEPSVSVGDGHALVLRSDNTVWSWGSNTSGQLGLGGGGTRSVPTRIQGLDGVVSVVARGSFSMALKADGTVWTWGASGDGRVEPGVSSMIPLQVHGLSGIVQIDAGHTFAPAFAVDGTGNVFAWGSNGAAQLGTGVASLGRNAVPQQVMQAPGTVSVRASNVGVLSLREDGAVLAWGGNESGALVPGVPSSPLPPTMVQGLPGIRAVAATSINTPGQYYALAVDGTVSVWGQSNTSATFCGRDLGPEPVLDGVKKIGGLSGIVALEGGDGHTLFVDAQGALFGCGINSNGQLGDGTFTDPSKFAPKIARVVGLAPVLAAAAGSGTSAAVTEDGGTWVWGKIRDGLAGNGDAVLANSSAVPIQVAGFDAGRIAGASPAFAGTLSGTAQSASVDVGLAPAPEHRGLVGRIYLIGLYGDQAFMLDSMGNWVPYTGNGLTAVGQGPLPKQLPLPILRNTDVRGLAGLTLFVGYGVGVGAAADEDLFSNLRFREVIQFR